MKLKLKKEDFPLPDELSAPAFPKYTSQLMNLANQNAQGTRPSVVGQMSELFPAYCRGTETPSVKDWAGWYTERQPNAIETATDRVLNQISNLQQAMKLIDRDMVKAWVTDLVIHKTYTGLYYQRIILAYLAHERGESWRLATPAEESQGIDGFVGSKPYSIKPRSYQTKDQLPEQISVTIIYYSVSKDGGLNLEFTE